MYKSGDSQNFLNATQGVDGLVDGFGAGIEAAVQTLQRHAQERQHIDAMNETASRTQWEQYAGTLARENQRLIQNLANLRKDYAKLERKFNSVQNTFTQYNGLLVTRIRKLDEAFQRLSANEFAYNKMRCALIDVLEKMARPSVISLISDEEQKRLLQNDWDYFMEHQNVRMGVPDVAEIPTRQE
jgi:hypothetical protein